MIRINWKTPWLSTPPNVQRVRPCVKTLPIITRKSSSGNAITRSVNREMTLSTIAAEVARDADPSTTPIRSARSAAPTATSSETRPP